MSCASSVSSCCMTTVLCTINGLLLGGSAIVLYIGMTVTGTGLLDVISAYWTSAAMVLNMANAFAGIVAAIALLGILAAFCQWRTGLCVYTIILCFMMVFAAAIAGLAFLANSTAAAWVALPYPADDNEDILKKEFDKIYCFAQAEYVCNSAPMSDITNIFLPGVNAAALLGSFASVRGVNNVCNDSFVASVPMIRPVCQACEKAKPFATYSTVVDWTNDKCPRSNGIMLYCSNYITNSTTVAPGVGKAPYIECREDFLNFVGTSAMGVMAGAGVAMGGMLFVAVIACFMRSHEIEYMRPPLPPPPPAPQPIRYVMAPPDPAMPPPPPLQTVYRRV